MKIFIKRKYLFWPLVALFLTPLALQAEDKKPPSLAESWVVTVKDGMQDEFEKAFTDHMKARKKAGDPRAWQIYVPHTGESLNHYIIRYCCFNWADRDAYSAWGEKSKISEHWNKNVDPYVANYQHQYSRIDHENGNWKNSETGYKFVGVQKFKLKADSRASKSVAAISKMAKDMKWDRSWGWSYSVTGPEVLMLVFPYENFAAMEPPKVSFREAAIKHMKSEEKVDKMFDDFDSNFKSSSYTIYMHLPELSMEQEKK
ncbi:hypothetical protein QSV34_13055 [Porticoccus sp. W117]|uniref:hypothetical protein n=1 Tax=Porticoccus sp. W117 TaxID=3054777 RepID=UPI00259AD50E|nr:hypothetical protein [Porticoccus sp. W117]MDM3872277.1 hypothetical protein [Porticoccus sp. W117]